MRNLLIENVSLHHNCSVYLHDFILRTPQPQNIIHGFQIDFEGAIVPKSHEIDKIRIAHKNKLGLTPPQMGAKDVVYPDRQCFQIEWHHGAVDIPVMYPTPFFSQKYPDVEWAGKCGFFGSVGLFMAAGQQHELELYADIDDEEIFLGSITVSVTAEYKHITKLNPIIVTSLGRSGSSVLMGYLKAHSHIKVADEFPYEVKLAQRVIASIHDTADHGTVYRPERVAMDSFAESIIDKGLNEIDKFYSGQNIQRFAEKSFPCMFQGWFYDLYPGFKEIILVRDFRDILLSIDAFNKMRGFQSWGQLDSPQNYLQTFKRDLVDKFMISYRTTRGKSLLIKYEDLIKYPEQTIQIMLNYLDLESNKKNVQQIIDHNKVHNQHVTSPSVLDSVQRWKRDMDKTLLDAANEILADALIEFGYRSF